MAQLDSASNLAGHDAGGGDVALSWSYPVDIVVHSIVFDVFGSGDPLDVFHTRYAQSVAALSVQLSGFGLSGDRFFTVVARRGDELSLPSRLLRLAVIPPAATVTPTAGSPAAAGASGLGFPFGITAVGAIKAQGGNDLLRGKLLQLLLTVPGERVNLPDYGTHVMDLVFDPNSDVLVATVEFAVARSVQRYLGDEIQLDRVRITSDEATLLVDISYIKKVDLTSEQVRIGLPLPGGATP